MIILFHWNEVDKTLSKYSFVSDICWHWSCWRGFYIFFKFIVELFNMDSVNCTNITLEPLNASRNNNFNNLSRTGINSIFIAASNTFISLDTLNIMLHATGLHRYILGWVIITLFLQMTMGFWQKVATKVVTILLFFQNCLTLFRPPLGWKSILAKKWAGQLQSILQLLQKNT